MVIYIILGVFILITGFGFGFLFAYWKLVPSIVGNILLNKTDMEAELLSVQFTENISILDEKKYVSFRIIES